MSYRPASTGRCRAGRFFPAICAVLALAGCTRGTSDLYDWVAQEKAKRGVPISPLPVINTFETVQYNDQGLRDPFSPSEVELQAVNVGNNSPRPDQNRPKQPLEAFALDSLKMVGTLGSGSTIEVLIKEPGGVIHRVSRNDYMGQSFGRVTAIAEDHIDLVELVSNGNGGWMEHPVTIALAEK